MKSGFLDKLINRLDRVTPEEVQSLVTRLVKEKGFLENVFETLAEGVLVFDPDGVVTFSNTAANNILCHHEPHLVGTSAETLINGLVWKKIARPDRIVSRDFEIFYPENKILQFTLSPIRGEDDDTLTNLGYVMIIRDETDARREAEQELESEKLNALTLLAAGVAHEIGNPLNSINIHLQLLDRKLKKIESNSTQASDANQTSMREHLETAQREIVRLDGILKQFLGAVRPTTPQKKQHNLHKLLELTLSSIETELAQRNATVQLNLSDSLPLLLLDGDQIQQALYNLIRNASQSLAASGGEIIIKTESTPYEIRLSIIDDGEGMSPELMGSLFEPYKTTKSAGSGLGLLIVRRIIREQGGEMEIDSEVGSGTTVTLFLPREEKSLRLVESASNIIDVENPS